MSFTSFASVIISFEAYLTSKLASKIVGFQLLHYPLCLSIEANNVLWSIMNLDFDKFSKFLFLFYKVCYDITSKINYKKPF